jgi:hypothetical protein
MLGFRVKVLECWVLDFGREILDSGLEGCV